MRDAVAEAEDLVAPPARSRSARPAAAAPARRSAGAACRSSSSARRPRYRPRRSRRRTRCARLADVHHDVGVGAEQLQPLGLAVEDGRPIVLRRLVAGRRRARCRRCPPPPPAAPARRRTAAPRRLRRRPGRAPARCGRPAGRTAPPTIAACAASPEETTRSQHDRGAPSTSSCRATSPAGRGELVSSTTLPAAGRGTARAPPPPRETPAPRRAGTPRGRSRAPGSRGRVPSSERMISVIAASPRAQSRPAGP